MRRGCGALVGTLCIVVLTTGCESKESKQCRAEFASAQTVVNAVQADSLESVETSLDAVSKAHAACVAAELHSEAGELEKAKNKLAAQVKWLRERPEQRKALTPEQVAKLEANGDPSCPKGQAYKYQGKSKEIRCTGALPVDFTWEQATKFYGDRGYKIGAGDKPSILRAEYGAEHFLFHYDSAQSKNAPTCVEAFPPPEMSWQETTSRLTGIPPRKLKREGPVRTSRGSAKLRVEEDERKVLVQIGDCPAP